MLVQSKLLSLPIDLLMSCINLIQRSPLSVDIYLVKSVLLQQVADEDPPSPLSNPKLHQDDRKTLIRIEYHEQWKTQETTVNKT